MSEKHYIACDLGAESGRVMLGTVADGELGLEEVHRFPNLPVEIMGTMRWDVLGIHRELLAGLRKVADSGMEPESLSVDSWGVDYVWSGAGQPMLAPPFIYRDQRIDAAYADALERMSKETIFAETGIQFMPINTLYQMVSDHTHSHALVDVADRFLLIADFFHYLFSGAAKTEESLASTTQIYNPVRRAWSDRLIHEFGFRKEVFPEIVPSGTRLGEVLPGIRSSTGLGKTGVVATCSHDTGAAVAAVPAQGGDWAYLSSGTWSLLGVELERPLINAAAAEANFTNEGGFGGTTRFLKNIVGLWILQECKREWDAAGVARDYAELNRLAEAAPPLKALIDPDDARFLKPGDMPAKIEAYCRETGQAPPATPGETVRCILESLALLYRVRFDQVETLTGRSIRTLHIVGGGSRSRLLNQFTANATGRRVLAGPVEATASGNILIQAIVSGQIGSLAELRSVVRASSEIVAFQPEDADDWNKALERFRALRRG